MVFAVIGATIAFNVAVYLVLAIFLREMKRKSSYTDVPELRGVPEDAWLTLHHHSYSPRSFQPQSDHGSTSGTLAKNSTFDGIAMQGWEPEGKD